MLSYIHNGPLQEGLVHYQPELSKLDIWFLKFSDVIFHYPTKDKNKKSKKQDSENHVVITSSILLQC